MKSTDATATEPTAPDATAQREAAAIMDALRVLVSALRAHASSSERASGLSGAQVFVLQLVGRTPGLSLRELADQTLTDPSSVSVVVARLVGAGLVLRRNASTDARRAELRLSAKGRALASKLAAAPQARVIRCALELPAAERRAAARALGRMTRDLADRSAAPAMFFEPPDVAAPRARSRARG
ncbi:MAG: MarR family transcriptional regulator [Planctomycetota bacterium]|nr:MAG: MarR family transcriptional regulator [Planctomycetota bacterium]